MFLDRQMKFLVPTFPCLAQLKCLSPDLQVVTISVYVVSADKIVSEDLE